MDASAANANREKWFAVTFSRTAGANPDLIRLDYAAGVANNLHLDLYDAAGQLLTSGSATAQGETIRQGGLSGLYYIRVRGASTTVTNPGFAHRVQHEHRPDGPADQRRDSDRGERGDQGGHLHGQPVGGGSPSP